MDNGRAVRNAGPGVRAMFTKPRQNRGMSKPAAKPAPVTRHPAFPLVAGLWCAVAAGALGFGVLQVLDLEARLGLTGALAVIAGLVGAALGQVLGRRQRYPAAVAPRERRRAPATPAAETRVAAFPVAPPRPESLDLAQLTARLSQAVRPTAHLAGRGEDYLDGTAPEEEETSAATYASLLAVRLPDRPTPEIAMPESSERALRAVLASFPRENRR